MGNKILNNKQSDRIEENNIKLDFKKIAFND